MLNKTYTAKEARERLGGISPEALRRYVDSGKIRKYVPPTNKTKGFYDKGDVDALSEALEDFVELHTIVPVSDKSEFALTQAEGEDDIKESVQIARQHLGDNAYGLEKRMAWFKKFPNGDYVLKYNGVVVGYFSMQAVKEASIERVFDKRSGESIQLEDMEPIMPNKSLNIHISGIAVRKGISKQDAKKYGMDLLSGILDQLVKLAEQGIEIKKIWAKSSTVPGIKLSRDAGFEELGYINNEQIGFLLDMDPSKATKPLVKHYLERYQEAVKRGKKSKR